MIDVLWNSVNCIGLVALVLVIVGACILMVCGVITVVKSIKE
nr:MAG TPA: hypothetical protein [Caudoviricetes sp.]